MIGLTGGEPIEFAGEFVEHAVAVPALALGLLRVEAEHVATAAFALADHHFLDLKVVGNRLVAARPAQHLGLDLSELAQRCRQDVAPETARQRQEIGRRIHPGIADKDAAAEPPGTQILLDPGDGGDIGGVARQHQERTGMPSRVTASATITCGWLSRPSLLWPRRRSGA